MQVVFILLANAPLAAARAARPVPEQPGCLALRFGAGPAFALRVESELRTRASDLKVCGRPRTKTGELPTDGRAA